MVPEAVKQARSEALRWHILTVIDMSRPSRIGVTDSMCLDCLRPDYPDTTLNEVREELDYLEKRQLVQLSDTGLGKPWRAVLTRTGIDLVEYTIDCAPGIARPARV